MKNTLWILVLLVSFSVRSWAQAEHPVPSIASQLRIVERGPHQRVFERRRTETLPDGRTAERKSSYTELATGLHYWEDNQWRESKEEIEIFQGFAVARQGQHRVTFAANLNSPGAIDMVTPDGKRFRSTILGLVYTDYASGRSAMISEITDCVGVVLPPNQVLYPSALRGDCLADVVYTYTKSQFEQDVIWLTAPPPPEAYGLNPATTRAEVWTEFVEIPEGTVTPVVLKRENDPVARQQRVEPDLIDQRLDFGIMKFEEGHAFPMEQGNPFSGQSLRTGKSVERIDGRVFLIEKLDYADVRAHLQQLPQQAAARPRRQPLDGMNGGAKGRAMFARAMPVPKGARGEWKEKQYARVEPNRRGFVWDYVAINGSLTNYVLQGTVHVTGAANLYGTTVLQGGTVTSPRALDVG